MAARTGYEVEINIRDIGEHNSARYERAMENSCILLGIMKKCFSAVAPQQSWIKKVDIRVGQMTVTLGLMSNCWKDGLLLGSCGYALLGLLYG